MKKNETEQKFLLTKEQYLNLLNEHMIVNVETHVITYYDTPPQDLLKKNMTLRYVHEEDDKYLELKIEKDTDKNNVRKSIEVRLNSFNDVDRYMDDIELSSHLGRAVQATKHRAYIKYEDTIAELDMVVNTYTGDVFYELEIEDNVDYFIDLPKSTMSKYQRLIKRGQYEQKVQDNS